MDEEDLETLEKEQAQLDNHEVKTTNLMDHVIRLGHTKPSPTVVASPMGLETATELSPLLLSRLHQLESRLRCINLTIEMLTPGPDRDACLFRQLQKQVSRINAEHSGLTCDILSLEHEDGYLLDLSLALAKTLFDMSLQTERE